MLAREVICSADTGLDILVVFAIHYDIFMRKKKKQNLHRTRGIGIYFNIKGGGLRKEDNVFSCFLDLFGKVSVEISPVTA